MAAEMTTMRIIARAREGGVPVRGSFQVPRYQIRQAIHQTAARRAMPTPCPSAGRAEYDFDGEM